MRKITFILIISIFILSCSPSSTPSKTAYEKIDKDPKSQELRLKFIQKCIQNGVFKKVEVPASLPHLWVKPKFYLLDFENKQNFVSVVHDYYLAQNPSYTIVVLYDSHTGKEIGEFTAQSGLKLK